MRVKQLLTEAVSWLRGGSSDRAPLGQRGASTRTVIRGGPRPVVILTPSTPPSRRT